MERYLFFKAAQAKLVHDQHDFVVSDINFFALSDDQLEVGQQVATGLILIITFHLLEKLIYACLVKLEKLAFDKL